MSAFKWCACKYHCLDIRRTIAFQTRIIFFRSSDLSQGTFHENQMHAKVYIVIPIVKQILSALRNRFPFLDRTSQRQDMEKNIWTDFNFNTLLTIFVLRCWRTKVANFRYCPPVSRRRALMGLLRVGLKIEFGNPVVLAHSCVHDRLRPREMIGFNDDSRYLCRIQMRGYG